MQQSGHRYVVRPNPHAPDLWDVIDTMRAGDVVLGGKALTRGQATELAERLSRHYREWWRER